MLEALTRVVLIAATNDMHRVDGVRFWNFLPLLFLGSTAAFVLRRTLGQRLFLVFARSLLACFYRIRIHDQDRVPESGGVILVCNHVSWFDGILMMAISPRVTRSIVFEGNFKYRWLRRWADRWQTVMIETGPKKIIRALREVQAGLKRGDTFLLFAEGGITRSGQLRAFRPGLMKMIEGTDATIVPVFLDELWGSIFSFSGGRFFRKFPTCWRYPVSVHYGQPITDCESVHQVRQAVQQLGANAVQQRQKKIISLPVAALKMCKRRLWKSKFADSSGSDATGGHTLLRALILRRILRRRVLKSDEHRVGVLLPPSVGGVLANLALAWDGRTCVNLNYTLSESALNHCIAEAGIQHVLSSRQVTSKLELKLDAETVHLDDFKDQLTLWDKIVCGLSAFAVPGWLLVWALGLRRIRGSDVATIIFTSGSTGTPKGVELTFDNVASNVEAIDQVIHLVPADVVVGILPFFHSFGYTVTLWTPAALDIKSVYHYSPLDGKRVGMLAKKHGATVLLSTPTFLRTYLNRCSKEQFATLDVVVAGAEKLPTMLCDAFENKFGVRPVEGYGCTELSPLAAVNIPKSRASDNHQIEQKEGTVGRPIPNVAAKIVNLESGQDCPINTPGMLLIKGPNVMKGYLNDPQKTAAVIRDGWYVTGDVALIDQDGFIQITGRESRFSKIGGEMVPHIQIEELLTELIGADEEAGLQAVVTAVPDEKKGERLVVLHTPLKQTPAELRAALLKKDLPPIFVPAVDDFCQVDTLPILGTGKTDLKGIKQLALQLKGFPTE